MNKKYISIDLDDPRISSLADVISNKTCKKILDYLAESEVSEGEIAHDLKLPANTVNYNIKKLLKVGLIEKSKDYSWSVKGKKIAKYRIANKKIVISPKSSGVLKSVLGAFVITGVAALVVKFYTGASDLYDRVPDAVENAAGKTEGVVEAVSGDMAASDVPVKAMETVSAMPEVWVWFLLGGVIALIVYMVVSRVKLFR